MVMRESDLEKTLKKGVEARGGECYKFTSPGRRGVPDRICLFTADFWFMVETKSPDGLTKPWQDREIARLRERGVKVFVLHDLDSLWHLFEWTDIILKERTMAKPKPKKPMPKPRPC